MGFFKKTDYEKHSNNLHKKLVKIVEALEIYELKDMCQKLIGKYPKNGTRLFDSDYNLVFKFSDHITKSGYLLFFTHYRLQGKCSDLKLAKFLIMRDILDVNDPDFSYLKQFAKSEDELDYSVPRNHFPQKVKDAVRKIQRNRCKVQGCRNTGFFEFDHIKGRDDNSLSNCQMLCLYHHRVKTNEDAIIQRIEKNLNDGQSLSEIQLPRIHSKPSHRNSTSKKQTFSRKSTPRRHTSHNRTNNSKRSRR